MTIKGRGNRSLALCIAFAFLLHLPVLGLAGRAYEQTRNAILFTLEHAGR